MLLSKLNQITGHKYTTLLFPFCQLLETKIVVTGKKFCKCTWKSGLFEHFFSLFKLLQIKASCIEVWESKEVA